MKSIFKLFFVVFIIGTAVNGYSQLTADFEADTLQGCSPLIVGFSDLSTGAISSWTWDLGNGNTSVYQNVQAVYSQPGDYIVSLTVSDGTNSATKSVTIRVFSNPIAQYTSVDTAGCIPFSTQFQDISVIDSQYGAGIEEWTWDFGDGFSSVSSAPIHEYSNNGNYTVSLSVIDSNKCEDSYYVSNYIQTVNPPNAYFYGNNTYTCGNTLTVIFSNLSSGANPTFEWNYGDGTIESSTGNGNHAYNGQGIYDVSLVATDQFGCTDTMIREDYIQLTTLAPEFTLENDTICLGDPIPFVSTPVGTSMHWDFGDGNTSNLGLPNHIYADTGSYTIMLVVTDVTGSCVDSVEKEVYVENILSSFTMDVDHGCDSLLVSFTDASVNASEWQWNFGDGSFSDVQNPQHLFVEEGNYQVELTAFTSNGCSNTFTDNVEIVYPIADFNADPVRLCINNPVSFTDLSSSTDPIIEWHWNFGDGNISTEQHPEYTYTTDGDFDVVLTIINQEGCSQTDTMLVEVGFEQIPAFQEATTDSCASYAFEFEDLSTDTLLIDEWNWMFGDGGTSVEQDASHQFTDTTGYFDVMLSVGYNGCFSDTLLDSVFVMGPIADIDTVNFRCDQQGYTPNEFVWNFSIHIIEGDSLVMYFGDGDSLNVAFTDTVYTDTITHIFETTGNFPVELIAFNDTNMCDFPTVFTAQVRDIEADYGLTDTLPCYNETIVLNALDALNSSQHAVEYEWFCTNPADVTQLIGEEDTITYVFGPQRGDYYLKLIAEDVNGCVDSITKHIRSYKPFAGYIQDTVSGCFPFDVSFTDTTWQNGNNDTTLAAWIWNFGDTFTDTIQNPVHTYNTQGVMGVSMRVVDVLGCAVTISKPNLIISPKPYVSFTLNDSTLCLGDSVQYTNASQTVNGYPVDFEWFFGDSNSDNQNQDSVWHTYADSGYYDVTLAAYETTLGCDTILQLNDFVHYQSIPDAYFVADPPFSNCYYPQAGFTFIDSTLHPYKDSWFWSFGDGGTSSVDSSSTHTYFVPDTFNIVMSVTTTYGCSDTDSISLIVRGPLAEIDYVDSICNGVQVDFQVYDTVNLSYYYFDFGDGTGYTGNENEFSHIYDTYGDKNTSFFIYAVYSNDTCVVPKTAHPVYVYQLNADFIGADTIVCAPYFVDYEDISVVAPITWEWEFGNGNTSFEQNPYTEYFDPGEYNVRLKVSSGEGCFDSITKGLTVRPLPEIIPSDTNILCKGESIGLSITPESGIEYEWSTGNTEASIEEIPHNTQEYSVSDQYGCEDEYIVEVDQGVIDVPTAFSPNGDGVNDYIYVAARDLEKLVEFKIFNRWGEVVFSTDNIDAAWDGNYNGMPQNPDNYAFVIKAITKCGKEVFKKGYITLLR